MSQLPRQELLQYVANNRIRLGFDSWASLDGGFVYINVPKAACTKIKKTLQELCGFEVPSGVSSIHQRKEGLYVKSLLDHTEDEIWHLLSSPEVLRFSFVRNPYTRLVSTFFNKVVGKKKYGSIYEHLVARRAKPSKLEPSFEEFLSFLENTVDHKRDIHWRSQFAVLHYHVLSYNFIGKVERFAEDMTYVLTHLDGEDVLIKKVHMVENPSYAPDADTILSLGHRERIYNLFENDFTTFDYPK